MPVTGLKFELQNMTQLRQLKNPAYIRWLILSNLRDQGPVVAELPVQTLRERSGYPEDMSDDFVRELRCLRDTGEVVTNYRPDAGGAGTKYYIAVKVGTAPKPPAIPATGSRSQPVPKVDPKLMSKNIEASRKAKPKHKTPGASPKPVHAKPTKPSTRTVKTDVTIRRELAILRLACASGGVLEYVSMRVLDKMMPAELQFMNSQGPKYILDGLQESAEIKLESKRGLGLSRLTVTEKGWQRLAAQP